MCDYSLSGIPNRPAIEGERLTTYLFPNGVMGFVSETELAVFSRARTSLWTRLRAWLNSEAPCAVCLPAGATLVLRDTPAWLRTSLAESDEVVSFFQDEPKDEFRDAIRSRRGTKLLIQQLPERQVADVLSLTGAAQIEPARHAAI